MPVKLKPPDSLRTKLSSLSASFKKLLCLVGCCRELIARYN
jgi:hypothetical protein